MGFEFGLASLMKGLGIDPNLFFGSQTQLYFSELGRVNFSPSGAGKNYFTILENGTGRLSKHPVDYILFNIYCMLCWLVGC